MTTATLPAAPLPVLATYDTVADLLHELGDIPAERVLWSPRPGTATEKDAVARSEGDHKRIVELIDGTLVEKAMGQYESRLGIALSHFIESYLDVHEIGFCYGADTLIRVLPEQIRAPDVSFIPWTESPGLGVLPPGKVASVTPGIAIEIISASNTRRELARKRREYFGMGTKLVWQIDPITRTAQVFTGPDDFTNIPADGTLSGAEVLPGFTLALAQLFRRAGRWPDYHPE